MLSKIARILLHGFQIPNREISLSFLFLFHARVLTAIAFLRPILYRCTRKLTDIYTIEDINRKESPLDGDSFFTQ
jgi:hypothetical protein